MPLLDLHAHFPMHTKFPPRCVQGPPPIGKDLEFWAANMLFNFNGGKPRVTLSELLAGASGGIASVLYDPDDEFFHDAKPMPAAFDNLLAQLNNVEREVKGRAMIARNPSQVKAFLQSGEKFLFHCVEGGFGLGGNAANVDKLAALGVAYIIPAHLFFRGVATCENALPFVPDSIFAALNPQQPAGVGLTQLGHDIVDRCCQKKILVDITHSTQLAQSQIFDIANAHGAPVISSHNAVRGVSDYAVNLSKDAVLRIAASKGVIGVILSTHWLRRPNEQIFGTTSHQLVFRVIDCIHQWTGTYDNIAIGSDLDGFITPIRDCIDYTQTPSLVNAIRAQYPGIVADKILWGNALDVLERGWAGV